MFSFTIPALDLYQRLFNHRPFVQGEVKRFVREFEDSRGDREVENVFSTLERVTELTDCEVDNVKAQCDSSLPNLNANLLVAESMCGKILARAESSEIVRIFINFKRYFYDNQSRNFSRNNL